MDWHDDESFWDEFYPAMHHEGRWAVAEEEASQISNLLELSQGDSVLDIGRELAADEGLEVEFILEDAREYQGEVRYDAAVCM